MILDALILYFGVAAIFLIVGFRTGVEIRWLGLSLIWPAAIAWAGVLRHRRTGRWGI